MPIDTKRFHIFLLGRSAVIIFALAICLSLPVLADDFSYSKAEIEQLSYHDSNYSQNIMRLCDQNGAVVFSNIALSNHQPCGDLETAVLCDASGQKYLSKQTAPHGYLDCDMGPRIQVLKNGKVFTNLSSYSSTLQETPSYPFAPVMDKKTQARQTYMESLDRLLSSK